MGGLYIPRPVSTAFVAVAVGLDPARPRASIAIEAATFPADKASAAASSCLRLGERGAAMAADRGLQLLLLSAAALAGVASAAGPFLSGERERVLA